MNLILVGLVWAAMGLIVVACVCIGAILLVIHSESSSSWSGNSWYRLCWFVSGVAALSVLLIWNLVTDTQVNSVPVFAIEWLIGTISMACLSMIVGTIWMSK